ncbi:hypothetical protein MXB_4312 [Myxobolus squamalis]|nr:hypothetical protein MXB_4312 [Myxobolus squamalis]
MQIWDTAGQEKFRSLIPGYIRDSSVAIVIYDITDKESFEEILFWIKLVQDEKDMIIVIVGNKTDLDEKRVVQYEEGKKRADENNALFFETSAFNGTEIENWLLASIALKRVFSLDDDWPPPLRHPRPGHAMISA